MRLHHVAGYGLNLAPRKLNAPPPAASAPASSTPPVINPPGSVSVVAGDGQAIVTFKSLPRATSYNLFVSSGGGRTQTIMGVTSGYVLSGLVDGTTYSISVAGVNAAGVGPSSAAVQVTPVAGTVASSSSGSGPTLPAPGAPAPIPPTPTSGNMDPTGVSATVNADNSVTVDWTDATGASAYNIYWGTGAGQFEGAQVTATSAVIASGVLAPGTYSVSVTALYGSGRAVTESPGNNAVSITIPPPTAATAAAANVNASASATTVVTYDANGNPLNAAGQIIPGAPTLNQATNGTVSNSGSGASGSGSGGSAPADCSGVVAGYDANGNPVDCNGTIVSGAASCSGVVAGYDSNGNPMDCNGVFVANAAACQGVVAGYDSNGDPIDCNGIPVQGASPCGGVMAGTDMSGNPVDCNGLPVSAAASVQPTPGGALATAMAIQAAPGGALTTDQAAQAQMVGTPVQVQSGAGIWWLLGGVAVVGIGAYVLGKD